MIRCLLLAALAFGCQQESAVGDPDADGGTPDAGRSLPDTGGLGGGGGSGPCEASDEICNGSDDDCDGNTDEGFGIGAPCLDGMGECQVEGRIECGPDGAATCSELAEAGAAEQCDGLDNDCDGAIDEDFDTTTDPDHCGGCGASCLFANAQPECIDSACTLAVCLPGFGDANGVSGDGCECEESAGGGEVCDGVDNDCDGELDEGFGVGDDCEVGVGACLREGALVCDDDVAACDTIPGDPAVEICNGVDDDCDGNTDEDFDADGDGAAVCPDGCEGDACPAEDCAPDDPDRHPGALDVCDDGIDQNCDGRDAPCDAPAGRITAMALDDGRGLGCRDFDGDSVPDNALAAAAGLANADLRGAINGRRLNMILLAIGLVAPADSGRFDLGIVVGLPHVNGSYDLDPDSVDDGLPRVMLPGEADEGAMLAGPGVFNLTVPFNGVDIPLRIDDARLTGTLSVVPAGVEVEDGWITGAVHDAELRPLLMLFPANVRPFIEMLLVPDVDTNGDRVADAYSACMTFTAAPTTLNGFPP